MNRQIDDKEISNFNKAVKANYLKAWNFLESSQNIKNNIKNNKFKIYDDDEIIEQLDIFNDKKQESNNKIDFSNKNRKNIKLKFRKILYDDVKYIGWKISFKFKLKRVPKNVIINSLTKSYNDFDTITIDDLQNILSNLPFKLENKNEIEILSRYFIEKEMEDDELCDDEQKVIIIKSIFNKLLGNYENFEFYQNLEKIKLKIEKKRITIEQNNSLIPERMTMEEIEEFISQFLIINLNNLEYEALFWRLFLESFDLNSLPFKHILLYLRKDFNPIGLQIRNKNFLLSSYLNDIVKNSIEKDNFILVQRNDKYANNTLLKEKYRINYNEIPLNNLTLQIVLYKILKSYNINVLMLQRNINNPSNKNINLLVKNNLRIKNSFLITIKNYKSIYDIENKQNRHFIIEKEKIKKNEERDRLKHKRKDNFDDIYKMNIEDINIYDLSKIVVDKISLKKYKKENILIFNINLENDILSFCFCIKINEDNNLIIEEDFKYNINKIEYEINIKSQEYKNILEFSSDLFDEFDIKFFDVEEEKIMIKNEWVYFTPKQWIKYNFNLKFLEISNIEKKRWVPMYCPIESINLSFLKDKLLMSDDIGPNNLNLEFNEYPLDEGIFLAGSLEILLGYNTTGTIHLNPYKIEDTEEDVYFFVALECMVKPSSIRIPSIFDTKKIENLNFFKPMYKKYLKGEYFLINKPNDIVVSSILIKKIDKDVYNNYINLNGKLKKHKEKEKTLNDYSLIKKSDNFNKSQSKIYKEFETNLIKNSINK